MNNAVHSKIANSAQSNVNELSTDMQRTILLVDDEENILRSLTRVLRRDGYNILQANNGADGLGLLKENDVGVIISDQRMPQMTGIEFLSQVKELYPDTMRIVLSGYTELRSITDAINQGAIYKFLTKPWDDGLLRMEIEDAFRQYELRSENKRLTKELREANHALSRVNEDLERRVAEKTNEVILNLQTLQISQEVLENLSIAVLGIGDDGIIVVANHLAHELLSANGGCLVGRDSDTALPEKINRIHLHAQSNKFTNKKVIEINDDSQAEVSCFRLGKTSHAQGTIVVLTPQ